MLTAVYAVDHPLSSPLLAEVISAEIATIVIVLSINTCWRGMPAASLLRLSSTRHSLSNTFSLVRLSLISLTILLDAVRLRIILLQLLLRNGMHNMLPLRRYRSFLISSQCTRLDHGHGTLISSSAVTELRGFGTSVICFDPTTRRFLGYLWILTLRTFIGCCCFTFHFKFLYLFKYLIGFN